jgi:hypothetical protein
VLKTASGLPGSPWTPWRPARPETSASIWKPAPDELKPDLEASESFHKQWVGRLRAEAPDSVWEKVVGSFRAGLPTRRVAWPVLGAVAVVSAALLLDWWRREVAAPRQPGTQRVEAAGQKDLPPTIANYQMVARQSAEKLDELLTRQGTRARLPVPVYTAATLPSADALD